MPTTFRKRPTPRHVLRARHGITLPPDPSAIAAAFSALLSMPSARREATYARWAASLAPQRAALDREASLARLDCDVPTAPPRKNVTARRYFPSLAEAQRRYRPATEAEVDEQLRHERGQIYSIHLAGGLAGIAGLACPVNSVFCESDGQPRVFLPDAFDVAAKGVAICVAHKQIVVLRAGDPGLTLWSNPAGLWMRAILPDTSTGQAVLAAMQAGDLGGLSICHADVSRREVGGVVEISRTVVCEVSLCNRATFATSKVKVLNLAPRQLRMADQPARRNWLAAKVDAAPFYQ